MGFEPAISAPVVGTDFEFRLGRMFVIELVHIQGSKLFKGLECAVLSMVLCAIKSPKNP